MLPDLESLRCFEAAATHLSFRAAAEKVALSPAAFSDRIKRLEEQLDARLFERTTRRVDLTPAGRRLLPQARSLLDQARRCAVIVQEDRHPPFELTIGTRFELGLSWIVPSLGALAKARPERRVHVLFGDSADLLARLLRGGIDCFVSSARLTTPGLGYALLHRERYAFVGSPELLAGKPLRGPADAAEHDLIDAHPDLPLFRYFLDARPAREVWSFRASSYLGTIAAVRQRVLEGAGVAVLPRYFIAADLDTARLAEPLPRAKLQEDFFRLIWRDGHPLADELVALAEQLRAIELK
jgi:DNA-binding transcriptional LysR family regulator